MTTASNLGFIDFHPHLYMLFCSPSLYPFLLNKESYYFEPSSSINGRHVMLLLVANKCIERGKKSRSSKSPHSLFDEV
jgi:hypothetical protein